MVILILASTKPGLEPFQDPGVAQHHLQPRGSHLEGWNFFLVLKYNSYQGCVQFRVESTLTHSTQFSFELTFELIFECATLWMPIHWAEWGFIGLVRTIPFNSHSRIDSLLSKSSHGWECECARMAFELDTTLIEPNLKVLPYCAVVISRAQGDLHSSFFIRTFFIPEPQCS